MPPLAPAEWLLGVLASLDKRAQAERKALTAPLPEDAELGDLGWRIKRARAYLRKMPPAIQGEGGSVPEFSAAIALVRGFMLSDEWAKKLLLEEYNPRCMPPWSEKEIDHKIKDARLHSRRLFGYLLVDRTDRPARAVRPAPSGGGVPAAMPADAPGEEPAPAGEAETEAAPKRGRGRPPAPWPSVAPGDARPLIDVRQEIHLLVDAGLAALAQAGDDVRPFVRGSPPLLVRPTRGAPAPAGLAWRAPDALSIQPLGPPAVLDALSRAAQWHRVTAEGEVQIAWPPTAVAGICASRPDGLRAFPPLLGVSEVPVLRPDGSVWQTPGYDSETGVLYEPCCQFPEVPERPSRDDAVRALGDMIDPLQEICWAEPTGLLQRSSALALTLTLLARRAIAGPVPAWGISAPVAGSGKTKLARCLAVMGTGRMPAVSSAPEDQTEMRKWLLAAALAGDPVMLLDNVVRTFGSGLVAEAITAGEWRDRVLGKSEERRVPLDAVFIATGNNLSYRDDVARRIIPVLLDPRCERPEERTFSRADLEGYVLGERARLVVAGLTALRAYAVAKRPPHGGPPMGSFEAWDGWVRGALVWCGCDDPCAGREALRDTSDDDRVILEAALTELARWQAASETMAKRQRDSETGTADLWAPKASETAGEAPGWTAPEALAACEADRELRSALAALAHRPERDLDARALGRALGRACGRRIGSHQVVRRPGVRRHGWWVVGGGG